MTDPIRTPTSIVVLAACPSCSLVQPLRVYLNAELVISDEGSVLALKAKASKAEHICGQAGLFDEEPESAKEEALGVSIGEQAGAHYNLQAKPRHYTSLVADGETLDHALVRVDTRDDYQDVIGSEAYQALLEAIRLEGGAFVPFLTSEQLAGGQVAS